MSRTDPFPKTSGARNPTRHSTTPIGPVIEPHLPLTGYYEGEAQRAQYVRQLFDRTAGDYDRVERILGLGSGRWYRRQALARAGVGPGAAVLDVGCGTGLLSREALHLIGPSGRLVGVDPSPGMLAQAELPGARLLEGIAEELPVADASFDFVTLGYALRHVGDLQAAFQEFYRVLKPGGTVLLLEIGKPQGMIGRTLLKAYMRGLVPLLAAAVGRDKATPKLWRYFWDTIEACVPPQRVLDTLLSAGFTGVRRQLELGLFCEYLGRKSLEAGGIGSAVNPTGTSIGTSTGTSLSR
ncbi:MAG: class I SAM-dependent methyltransferase [Lautropia sp.]|nr:class I SAM-dependent methyltransferase [Lautropia sp.]